MNILPMQTSPSPVGHQVAAHAADTAGNTSKPASASIGATDFLQLLVTEMKNQDPTADRDPNQYINQLVQVNSLEQLIQINEDLGGGTSSSATSGSGNAAVKVSSATGSAASTGNLSANETGTGAARITHAFDSSHHQIEQSPAAGSRGVDSLTRAFANTPQASRNSSSNPVR